MFAWQGSGIGKISTSKWDETQVYSITDTAKNSNCCTQGYSPRRMFGTAGVTCMEGIHHLGHRH